MKRMGSIGAQRLDFGEVTAAASLARGYRRGLRLATPFGRAQGRPSAALRGPFDRAQGGPEKYQILDVKRRRAQIRARRILGLT
jgi:hypothetical protein